MRYKIKGKVFIRMIVIDWSPNFLLVSMALATLSLLVTSHPLLLILWTLFLLLGVVSVLIEGVTWKNLSRLVSFALLGAGLFYMVENMWRESIAIEDWSSLRPEAVEEMRKDINHLMRNHLDGRSRFVRDLGEEIVEFYTHNNERIDPQGILLELLESKRIEQPDNDDFLIVLTGLDGTDIAWSGNSYFPSEVESSTGLPSKPLTIELFRGNIFTAAVITLRLQGIGVLTLYDHLEIRHHLSKRYAGSGRFIDRLNRLFGTEVSLYPANYHGSFEGSKGSVLFPFIFQGIHLGNWSVDPVDREGYIAKLGSLKNRFLPLLLFFPWLISLFEIKNRLKFYFLRDERSTWRNRLLYTVLLGFILLGLRIVLLEASFPSSWIGGALFSPRFFATGLLETGSISIGEFFISGLFISLFLVHVFPQLTGRMSLAGMSRKERGIWIYAGMAIALIISVSSPFVLERLFRDSLSSMVIDQAFIGSAVTIFWELSIFLLLFPLFLVVAFCLKPMISLTGKKHRPGLICALLSGLFFLAGIYLATFEYGDKWFSVFGVVEGGIILLGGGWLSTTVLRNEETGNRQPHGWLYLEVIILLSFLSACVIYPGHLRYRHLILEETGEDLIEQVGAPFDNWATFVLEEVADELLDRKGEIFSETRDRRGLGFYTWANSRLSTLGQRTSLVIYDVTGQESSRFSLTNIEPDPALSEFFLKRAQEIDDPFIYHGFSRGNEFYVAVVPYWDDGRLKSFLTVTLPTDLEERLGGGPIKLFTDESEEIQWNVPEPMELRVYAVEEKEKSNDGVWLSSQDADGRFRYFRKQVQVGGEEEVVEVRFRVQGILESVSRVNFLFILHFLLMFILWGLSSSGYRGVSFREGFSSETYQRKLRMSLIAFSVIPTLMFGFIGGREIWFRIDQETKSRARDGLDAMIQLVKRDLGKAQGSGGSGEIHFYSTSEGIFARQEIGLIESDVELLIDNLYLKDISRMIGRDFLLFSANRLESTSQEDLVQAGMVPQLLGKEPYEELILNGKEYTFHRQSLGNYQYLVANKRLSPVGAEYPVILATPLLWRQAEIDQEVADLTYFVLMIINVILILSTGIGEVVGTHLSRPISQLRRAFEKVGSGDFRVELEKGRQDEFGILFSSFEVMSQQLETTQKKLSEEKARIDGVLQSVGAGILAFDSNGILKVVNARAISLIGEYLEDQVGRVFGELTFEEEGWNELIRGVQGVLQSGEEEVHPDFLVARGEELLTIRMTANRLVDEGGEKQGVVVAFEDISGTIRSQKIMAWGEMARQVAHEIKNPLTPIRLSIQHLHKTFQDGVPDFPRIIDGEVKVILREIDRLQRIAGDFSRYSRPVVEEVRRIEISSVVREVMELYEKEHGDISYSFVLEKGEIWALGSEDGLKKVLVNLIENGRRAISGHGELRVEVGKEGDPGAEMVVIKISDTGRGIPKTDMGKIFDPNFSTRSGGTGLGLAITKRIIEEWGGDIKIWSREGEGTRVEVLMKGRSG
jgi:signal transduction histidine kinase